LHPQDLWSLGEQLNYEVDLSWAAGLPDGSYDVVFRRLDADRRPPAAAILWPPLPGSAAEPHYANDPGLPGRRRKLLQQLRDYAAKNLPHHLEPAAFVTLDAIPRSKDGTPDRRGLPPPVIMEQA
jgi:hypothetical protein